MDGIRYEFDYLYMDNLCSHVVLYNNGKVSVENFTDSIIDRAFGVRTENLNIADLADLFEYRCFPRSRANCREILDAMGLDEYSQFGIVCKTHGVMCDDHYWIRFSGEDLCYDDVRVH